MKVLVEFPKSLVLLESSDFIVTDITKYFPQIERSLLIFERFVNVDFLVRVCDSEE